MGEKDFFMNDKEIKTDREDMMGNIDWDLIINYLNGDYSENDEKRINSWLQLNNDNKKEFDRIRKIWETPAEPLPKVDVEKALHAVADRANINIQAKESDAANILSFKLQQKRITVIQQIVNSKIFRIAAVLLIMITASYFLFKNSNLSLMNEILVENQRQEKIVLTDGTQVTLDAGSKFRYPEEFQADKREVFMNGEGYFEVSSDPEKPFIIHANEAIITVLGTKFNIRAWRQNKRVVVAVADGKVSLSSKKLHDKDSKVIISKNQVSQLEEDKKPTTPEYSDITKYMTWLNYEMHFTSVPLSEVLQQLERWYNLEFSLPDDSYGENRITVSIENTSIADILNMISLVNNFKYERKGNKIKFSPND